MRYSDYPQNYSKAEQTSKKCRLKESVIKDPDFLRWLHEEKKPVCMVCGKRNSQDPIELHHVKRCSSDPKNDTQVIPLCGNEHHRLGMSLSAHGTPRYFREIFSIDFQKEYANELYDEYLVELMG
jgi:hypothetical protein